MKSKVIFLDIDGVLNNLNWAVKTAKEEGIDVYYEGILHTPSVALLSDLVKSTDSDIVLSSSWRNSRKMYRAAAEGLAVFDLHISSVTPYMGSIRGNEIKAWLDDHPEVKSFVILDDDSDMGELMDHLAQTKFSVGLTKAVCDKAREILKTY